jgi:hypothetical protein
MWSILRKLWLGPDPTIDRTETDRRLKQATLPAIHLIHAAGRTRLGGAPELPRGTLLVQIDTDDTAEFSWGDCGRVYFFIPKADLLTRDFSRVWMIPQCF